MKNDLMQPLCLIYVEVDSKKQFKMFSHIVFVLNLSLVDIDTNAN